MYVEGGNVQKAISFKRERMILDHKKLKQCPKNAVQKIILLKAEKRPPMAACQDFGRASKNENRSSGDHRKENGSKGADLGVHLQGRGAIEGGGSCGSRQARAGCGGGTRGRLRGNGSKRLGRGRRACAVKQDLRRIQNLLDSSFLT